MGSPPGAGADAEVARMREMLAAKEAEAEVLRKQRDALLADGDAGLRAGGDAGGTGGVGFPGPAFPSGEGVTVVDNPLWAASAPATPDVRGAGAGEAALGTGASAVVVAGDAAPASAAPGAEDGGALAPEDFDAESHERFMAALTQRLEVRGGSRVSTLRACPRPGQPRFPPDDAVPGHTRRRLGAGARRWAAPCVL